MTREIFVCECHSLEHQFTLWYDEDDNMIYMQPRLNNSNNFFQRLVLGIKYIFGYKSRFGEWDEVIINPDDIERIKKVLDEFKQNI